MTIIQENAFIRNISTDPFRDKLKPMERNTFILLTTTIGSIIGGYIPSLWNASLFSFSGVLLSALGGICGIWIGYTLG